MNIEIISHSDNTTKIVLSELVKEPQVGKGVKSKIVCDVMIEGHADPISNPYVCSNLQWYAGLYHHKADMFLTTEDLKIWFPEFF